MSEIPDRWQWFTYPQDGIWDTYTSLTPSGRTSTVLVPLLDRVEYFSLYHSYAPDIFPIIW